MLKVLRCTKSGRVTEKCGKVTRKCCIVTEIYKFGIPGRYSDIKKNVI